MALITLKDALAKAEAGNYAVGAFNVSDLNQAYAVLEAARAENSPVIVQAIAGMSPYADERWWWRTLRNLIESYSDVSAVLHLDHGRTFEDCVRAIECGFSSVMIDASRNAETDEPNDLATNIARTREVVEFAHERGVSVEGELGTIGGAEAGMSGTVEEILYADPVEAQEFVAQTNVDALAIAIGTSHGSVKYRPGDVIDLRLGLVTEVKNVIPDTYLVLHGSSSVPAKYVSQINAKGGALPDSVGIDTASKQGAIARGIRKINQGTDSHLAWTAALRTKLHDDAVEVEPSEQLKPAIQAMSDLARQRMREFGSAGQDG